MSEAVGGARLTKDEAPCCLSRRDEHGRLPIGFCSDECLRRPLVASNG